MKPLLTIWETGQTLLNKIKYMESAIKIAQQAEKRKDEIEKNRNIPTDLIDQMKSYSLSRLWVA